jgi:OOP family OmpA-OmpF porin
MNNLMKGLLSSLLIAGSSTAMALDPYFFANMGQAKYDADDNFTDHDIYVSGGVGVGINEYFAVDFAYKDFGEATEGSREQQARLTANSFSISGIGKLPLNESFSLFLQLGIETWDAEARIPTATGKAINEENDRGDDFYWGIGASFDISDSVELTISYEKHSLDFKGITDLDIDIPSIGMRGRY